MECWVYYLFWHCVFLSPLGLSSLWFSYKTGGECVSTLYLLSAVLLFYTRLLYPRFQLPQTWQSDLCNYIYEVIIGF